MQSAANPLKIIFAGSGEFGLPTLGALLESGHEIVQVISQPDRPSGRGRQLTPTPIAQFAIDRKLKLVRTQDINGQTLPAADVMVVIAFGQKIAPPIVNHPRLGSINLHASLLPKYRGAAPINWAIINGEKFAGNTVIRLAQKMDAGAMLGMSQLEIGELETAGELHDRLSAMGPGLVGSILDQLARRAATEEPQNEAEATVAPKLSRGSSMIDWRLSADAIAQFVRGMHPWPGCGVQIIDEGGKPIDRVTLVRARAIGAPGSEPFGSINEDATISCAGSTLQIITIQPQGKRPMPLQSYRNGHAWDRGMRLESIVS